MTRFESVQQAEAFTGLMREYAADAAFTYDRRPSMVDVVMWRNDTEVCRGSITVGGHVRLDLTVEAHA